MLLHRSNLETVPTIHQNIPFRPVQRDEPEIPGNVNRSTETSAFRRIAMRAHYRQRAGGREGLSALHLELLRLERGALQHLPQLNHDERMEFIANAARLRNVTPRQIESYLDQASDRLMLQELCGVVTEINDLTEAEVTRQYHSHVRYSRNPDRRRGTVVSRAHAAR